MLWLEVNAQALTTAAGVLGIFSPLEFLHNTIKQLAVCPQGLGLIKWNTLRQGWF